MTTGIIPALVYSLGMVMAGVAMMFVIDPIKGRYYIPPLAMTAFIVGVFTLIIGQI